MSPETISSISRGIVVPAAISFFLVLCRKYLPARSRENTSFDDIDASAANTRVNIATAAAVIAFGIASFFLLREVNRVCAGLDGKAELTIYPGNYLWGFFPLFGAITIAPILVLSLWGLVGYKHAVRAYERWSDAKNGFRCYTVLRWTIVLLAFPVGVANLLAVPMHASFFKEEVTIGRYSSLRSEHHSYNSITRFRIVEGFLDKNGNFNSRPTVLLDFADGSQWSSWKLTEDRVLDPTLVDFISKKLNRQPEHVETE